jgi:hypothetical protein
LLQNCGTPPEPPLQRSNEICSNDRSQLGRSTVREQTLRVKRTIIARPTSRHASEPWHELSERRPLGQQPVLSPGHVLPFTWGPSPRLGQIKKNELCTTA